MVVVGSMLDLDRGYRMSVHGESSVYVVTSFLKSTWVHPK